MSPFSEQQKDMPRRECLKRVAMYWSIAVRSATSLQAELVGTRYPSIWQAQHMQRSRNRYYEGPASEHFDGTRFFNPGQPSTDRGPIDILRWRLTSAAARWPKSVPVTPAKPDKRVSGLRITMVGHASTLIQVGGVNILTDPVWSERAGPFSFVGAKRVTKPGIDFDDLPPIDAVLLSQSLYVHLDVATLRKLHAGHSQIIVIELGIYVIVREDEPKTR